MKKMSTESCFAITIFVMFFSILSLSPVEAFAPPVAKPKFNITAILERNKEFSTFVSLLNQTGLAKEINARETITILAVENGAIGGLASKSLDIVKDILSTHVILDYYGIEKLSTLSPKKNTTVTTMFQATGTADNLEGYLNIVVLPNHSPLAADRIRIGSAVKGAPIDIQLVTNEEFDRKKYDYVVLTVSGVIYTPGLGGMLPPPTSAPKKSPVAAPPQNKNTTSPSPSPDDEDDYDTAPEAAPPAEAPAPSSPSPSADAPTSDADNADKAAAAPPPKSSAMHISPSTYCFTALIAVLVSSFAYAGL